MHQISIEELQNRTIREKLIRHIDPIPGKTQHHKASRTPVQPSTYQYVAFCFHVFHKIQFKIRCFSNFESMQKMIMGVLNSIDGLAFTFYH